MNLTMKVFQMIVVSACILLAACDKQPRQVTGMHSAAIAVDSTLDAIQDSDYLSSLAEIRAELDKQLNVVIGYAPYKMTAYKPESPLLNWSSDALYDMAKQVQSGPVDFAVVNVGGIRCDWPAGNITWRHVFELMPFDNMLVVLTMEGEDVLELCEAIAAQGGQGVSRTLRMEIEDGEAEHVRLHGKPIDEDAVYYVATSDYLSTGMDNLAPLAHYLEKKETNLKIRDLYIDYVRQTTAAGRQVVGEMDRRIRIDD